MRLQSYKWATRARSKFLRPAESMRVLVDLIQWLSFVSDWIVSCCHLKVSRLGKRVQAYCRTGSFSIASTYFSHIHHSDPGLCLALVYLHLLARRVMIWIHSLSLLSGKSNKPVYTDQIQFLSSHLHNTCVVEMNHSCGSWATLFVHQNKASKAGSCSLFDSVKAWGPQSPAFHDWPYLWCFAYRPYVLKLTRQKVESASICDKICYLNNHAWLDSSSS